jgi:hypothetical protein
MSIDAHPTFKQYPSHIRIHPSMGTYSDGDDEGAWKPVTIKIAQPQLRDIEAESRSSNMKITGHHEVKDRDVDSKQDAITSFLSAPEPGQGQDAEEAKKEALTVLLRPSLTRVEISARSSSISSNGGGVSGEKMVPPEPSSSSTTTTSLKDPTQRRDSSATTSTAEAAMIFPSLTRHTARSVVNVPGAQAISGPGRSTTISTLALASGSERQSESEDEPNTSNTATTATVPERSLETALVAELADSDRDVVARVTDRLESAMTERLRREVAQQLEVERKRQVIVQAVRVSDYKEPEPQTQPQRRERVCGVTRSKKCWLVVLGALLLVLAICAGVAVAVLLSGGDDHDDGGGGASVDRSEGMTSPVSETTTNAPGGVAPGIPTASPVSESTTKAPAPDNDNDDGGVRFHTLLTKIGPTISDTPSALSTNQTTPQYQALHWLANSDLLNLDFNTTPTQILVERYALAVFYYSTNGESWLNRLSFLSGSTVCDWNDGTVEGVFCFGTRVAELLLCKLVVVVRRLEVISSILYWDSLLLTFCLSSISLSQTIMIWSAPFHPSLPC